MGDKTDGDGRPTKLTPKLQRRIVALVRSGSFLSVAAGACGVNRTTLYRWRKQGEAEPQGPYGQFCNDIDQARCVAETRALAAIKRAGAKHWQAFAWFLERSFPSRWSKDENSIPISEIEALIHRITEVHINRIPDTALIRVIGDDIREAASLRDKHEEE